ncbi:hypothetical protein NX059_003550 [Plenodomus lindquistii]|nr:hypothetical protein NX059_003550 [Plenodomus lindquistii]
MSLEMYPHRGFMLDTGRKFFPLQAILELLSVLSRYKYNVFHWHIYDSESFPMWFPADGGLTNVSMAYSHTPRYYTAKDIETVVLQGKRQGITVYPETEMPGHSDIWGLWKPELVVGKASLSAPQAQLDIRSSNTLDHVSNLITTVDKYFGDAPYHHFGGDEVAYIWETEDDNKLFSDYINFLKNLSPDKQVIMWDDVVTDEGKNLGISKDWIIQTWHNGSTQAVLDAGHRTIVSESQAFYIGNADANTIANFQFPKNPNVMGFEVVWFTSPGDDPYDFHQPWVLNPIKAAAKLRR